MKKKYPKLNFDQRLMVRRRGLDPDNYRLIKSTYGVLYLLDLRYNKVKAIQKWN